MNTPCRYPYNPKWKLIGSMYAIGLAVLVLVQLHWLPPRAGITMAAVPLLLALLITIRRVFFTRFLELDQDAVSVPTGFLRVLRKRISYAEIEWTRETAMISTAVLSLRTRQRTYEILSNFLPDMSSYAAVRDFLGSQVKKNAPAPRQRQPGDPIDYGFQCSYSGFGNIYDSDGKVIWHVAGQDEKNHKRYPYGAFRLPDFVVRDIDERELFRIRRARRLPMARFVMSENGLPICTIRQRSILLNRYTLDFVNGEKWTFHMPLFTVFFKGMSASGSKVAVRLWSHNVWYVRFDDGSDSPKLLAALAFIHRERLRCN